jgi:hypothetical protein
MAKGRGIDFEHRFNTSRWAEDLLLSSFSTNPLFVAKRFGLSEVRPEGRLVYGVTDYKEPDLLVYERAGLTTAELAAISTVDFENAERTRFVPGGDLDFAFHKARVAIEVEFSPYRSAEMIGRNWIPRTAEAWNRRPLKHAKPPTAPNIFVKEEDLPKLEIWQERCGVPILVVHLFDQEGFCVTLADVLAFNADYEDHDDQSRRRLQMTTGIFKAVQVYDRTDAQGAREEKVVFRIAPCAAVKVGDIEAVKVEAQLGVSTSGKYVSHVLFSGGRVNFSAEFLALVGSLRRAAAAR